MLPNGLTEHERNAEFYYHGTGLEYLEKQIAKYGRYQHDNLEYGEEVFVSINFETSKKYAIDRANMFRDKPIVLKLNGGMVRSRVHKHPSVNDICIDSAVEGEYELISLNAN